MVRERLGRIEHHGDLSISLRSAVSLFDFDFLPLFETLPFDLIKRGHGVVVQLKQIE